LRLRFVSDVPLGGKDGSDRFCFGTISDRFEPFLQKGPSIGRVVLQRFVYHEFRF
jgi:hypothetical protein